MTELKRVRNILANHMDELRETYGVGELGIFGSVARGEEETNDLDIVVTFTGKATLITLAQLKERLAELTESNVDVVTKNGLKDMIRDEILRETRYVEA